MKIGYARVSRQEQLLDRQEDALKAFGCERIYTDKASGKTTNRPNFEIMMNSLREGDVVVVVKLDRIGRNTRHLIELAEKFEQMKVNFVSLGDSIDTSSATGRLFFTILAAIAQFEADLNSERTKDGLSAARARGRVGGRPKVNASTIERAIKMYESNEFSLTEIIEMTGVSKTTLYRYLKSRTAK